MDSGYFSSKNSGMTAFAEPSMDTGLLPSTCHSCAKQESIQVTKNFKKKILKLV
ncbi:hypothetical protein OMAG_001986 [Candidatus Omnitrophus magneticus]|uniref:Uncharacterized protein n=1 Tax=Candidatus Omnitrophus magneticus TaxID=1609969 RepID=A0A0F0CQ37_9BACT|nr:hypothetical protein OMAG_001986 [Candidatus Omnitrophus magneticus]